MNFTINQIVRKIKKKTSVVNCIKKKRIVNDVIYQRCK